MNHYRFVYQGGSGEIEEKKSRFIAHVKEISTEQEALDFLAAIRKKYWDARHNCYAYVLGPSQELQRCSDDGEPGGTAGRPILDVLLREEIHNCIIVVTKYFGGTLLGTGGLVRAYQKASQEGLKASVILTKEQGFLVKIHTDYQGIGKIQYLLNKENIAITDSAYTDKVELTAAVPADKYEGILSDITQQTNGTASFDKLKEIYYTSYQEQFILLDQ